MVNGCVVRGKSEDGHRDSWQTGWASPLQQSDIGKITKRTLISDLARDSQDSWEEKLQVYRRQKVASVFLKSIALNSSEDRDGGKRTRHLHIYV